MKQYRKKPNYERTEGLHVIVKDNNVDKAMRKLKRMLKNAGILQEMKERQFFQKPSEKKRPSKKDILLLASNFSLFCNYCKHHCLFYITIYVFIIYLHYL